MWKLPSKWGNICAISRRYSIFLIVIYTSVSFLVISCCSLFYIYSWSYFTGMKKLIENIWHDVFGIVFFMHAQMHIRERTLCIKRVSTVHRYRRSVRDTKTRVWRELFLRVGTLTSSHITSKVRPSYVDESFEQIHRIIQRSKVHMLQLNIVKPEWRQPRAAEY